MRGVGVAVPGMGHTEKRGGGGMPELVVIL